MEEHIESQIEMCKTAEDFEEAIEVLHEILTYMYELET